MRRHSRGSDSGSRLFHSCCIGRHHNSRRRGGGWGRGCMQEQEPHHHQQASKSCRVGLRFSRQSEGVHVERGGRQIITRRPQPYERQRKSWPFLSHAQGTAAPHPLFPELYIVEQASKQAKAGDGVALPQDRLIDYIRPVVSSIKEVADVPILQWNFLCRTTRDCLGALPSSSHVQLCSPPTHPDRSRTHQHSLYQKAITAVA